MTEITNKPHQAMQNVHVKMKTLELWASCHRTFETKWTHANLENVVQNCCENLIPAFHGTWRFITALTSVRQLSLS